MSNTYIDDYVDEYGVYDLGRLEIGRVGIDTDLADPYQISQSFSGSDRMVTVAGHVKDTVSLADALHLRRELLYQTRTRRRTGVVALKSLVDPDIDGFYVLESASVDAHAKLASLQYTGFFPFQVRLRSVPSTMFQSTITGGVLPNDHGTVTGEGFIAPPVGFTSYTPNLPYISRTGDEGALIVFRGVTTRPTWSCPASSFYLGSAKIRVGGKLVAGLELPAAHGAWQLDNSLVRVADSGTGRLSIEWFGSSAWDSVKTFYVQENNVDVGTWDFVTILRNDPEAVSIRLVQDRVGTVAAGRRTLDLTIRRGSRFINVFYTTDSAATLSIKTTDGGSITTNLWGVNRGTNDADGNRWVIGTKQSFTTFGTVGLETPSATTSLDAFIGTAVGGGSAPSGDTPSDLYDQYIYHLHERVVPISASTR